MSCSSTNNTALNYALVIVSLRAPAYNTHFIMWNMKTEAYPIHTSSEIIRFLRKVSLVPPKRKSNAYFLRKEPVLLPTVHLESFAMECVLNENTFIYLFIYLYTLFYEGKHLA